MKLFGQLSIVLTGFLVLFPVGCQKNPITSENSNNLSNDIFVANFRGQVYGYDWETSKLVSKLYIEPSPKNITFSDDGRHIYVANATQNKIEVLDLTYFKIIHEVRLEDSPFPVARSVDGSMDVQYGGFARWEVRVCRQQKRR